VSREPFDDEGASITIAVIIYKSEEDEERGFGEALMRPQLPSATAEFLP
jgi:hypothetical protein